MKLESTGILIGMRPFGERDSVAQIFTRDFGILHGMLKGAVIAKKNKPLIGQHGAVSWNARLDSQLGAFHWEADKNLAAPLMMSAATLEIMNVVFSLVATLLPEREKYESLFDQTHRLLENMAVVENKTNRPNIYLIWEIQLLHDLGYALNTTSCSGCQCTDNLNYLSPRTGRAVCDNCAAPYIEKLFRLPLTLDITGKFLALVCNQQGVLLPQSRQQLSFARNSQQSTI